MSNISISIAELKEVLSTTPTGQNIMLTGRHGIGKSESLTAFFNGQGMKVVTLFLGQMSDPGDIIGLPTLNSETGRMEFTPPYWFPKDDEKIVLFLDELNRARPEILQVVMDLALNRRLAGRSLPEGSRIISAVNEGDQYQLTDLDPALVSRFNVYNFRPTVQEWLLWAKKSKVDNRVISFIEGDQGWLDGDPTAKSDEDTGLDKTPDRRAWVKVSDIIADRKELTPVLMKIIAGVVGSKATTAFVQSVGQKHTVSARELLGSWDKVKDTVSAYGLKEISILSESVFRHLEAEKVPEDKKTAYASGLDAYFDMLMKTKKESAGHFVSLFTNGQYPNAVRFISKEAPMVFLSLKVYIKSIQ